MFGNHTIGGAQSTQRSASLRCNKYDTEMFGFSQIPAIAAGGAYTTHQGSSLHQDLLSRAGITVFRSASTRPKGEPKRKKSVISKSNFPIFPPSNIVELLDRLDVGSFLRTLECKLGQEQKIKSEFYSHCVFIIKAWISD